MTDTPSDQPTTATPSDRATLLIAAGSATFAFMLGFNLGAFNAIFFDQLLLVWVISTIVLIASIISDLPPQTWPRRLVLLLPTLWLLSAWVDNSQDFAQGDRTVFFLTLAVTVVALPFVAWILVTESIPTSPSFRETTSSSSWQRSAPPSSSASASAPEMTFSSTATTSRSAATTFRTTASRCLRSCDRRRQISVGRVIRATRPAAKSTTETTPRAIDTGLLLN